MLIEKINYLFTLKTTDNKEIVKTGRKTFICGFASAVKSILHIAENIFDNRLWYKYILTYRFSQDHLELLFSKIRSRHGHNNNPNVLRFKYAWRQILMRNSIKSNSTSLNCLELDNDPSGNIFPIVWRQRKKENLLCSMTDISITDNELPDENELPEELVLPKNVEVLKENIICYIAGYIVKQLLKMIDCYNCYKSLIHTQEHNYTHSGPFSKFVSFSTNGGLVFASDSVHKILIATEKQIQIETLGLTKLTIKNLHLKILNTVKHNLALDNKIFSDVVCDVEPLEIPHKIRLINVICYRYLKIRLYTYGKFFSQEILQPDKKRHRLTKIILFSNQ